jgi:hypothetical protein
MESMADFGVPVKFAIPYGPVWTILNFVGSDGITIGYALDAPLKSICLMGTLDKLLTWKVFCGYHAPSHNFANLNLLEPIPAPSNPGFSFEASAESFAVSLGSISSIQAKSEVWVSMTAASGQGIVLESTDLSKSSHAKFNMTISNFSGVLPGVLLMKRTSLQAILSGFGNQQVKVAWDGVASHLTFATDTLMAVLSCSIKK